MFTVAPQYPGDAAKGGDFLTGAAQREIQDRAEAHFRPERIVVTDEYLPYQGGRVCLSETTIRHLAALVDLHDPVAVDRIVTENARLRDELDVTSRRLAEALMEVERLTTERAELRTVFVAERDGSMHGSELAAANRNTAPEGLVPLEAPEPQEGPR